MKAVVVELKSDLAAVLSDDGCVTTVKNNNYEIGQIIQINSLSLRFYKKVRVFAACAAAVLVLFGTGVWAYASPYTYVSMDVNPSIKFTINRFDRVLKVEAANHDGEKILNKISIYDLKNKTIESALSTSVDEIADAGYFDGTSKGGIVIATSSKNTGKAKELAKELQQTIKEETAKNGDDVEVEAFSVNAERRKEAEKLGVTPGKLSLVRKLQKAASDTETIDTEEWLNKPVKDIMKATKDYRDAAKKKQNSSSDTTLADTKDKNSKNSSSVQNSKDKKTSVENKSKKQETSQASADTKVTTKQKAKTADNSNGSVKNKVNNSKKNTSKTTAKLSDTKISATGSSKKTSNKSTKKSSGKSSSQTGQTPTEVKDTSSGNSQASGNNAEDKSQANDSKNQDASDKSGGNSQSSDNKSGSGSTTADGKTDSSSQSNSSNGNSSHSNK